jgi:hypothetical protein
VIEAIRALRPDSICGGRCSTLQIDSTIRLVDGLIFGHPHNARPSSVISAAIRAEIRPLADSIIWASDTVATSDSRAFGVFLSVVQADTVPPDVILFSANVVPPGGALEGVAIRMSRVGGACRLESKYVFART